MFISSGYAVKVIDILAVNDMKFDGLLTNFIRSAKALPDGALVTSS